MIEIGAEQLDDAESLARRCLHNNPAMGIGNTLGTQALKTCDLGLYIIGFDIKVNTAGVVDLLHLDLQVFRFGFQPAVF